VSGLRSGDRREVLEALQATLADALGSAEVREVAPLVKRLLEVTKELAEFPSGERSAADDLASKRAARRAGAQGVDVSSAGVVGGPGSG
jgi:hypothetical protein